MARTVTKASSPESPPHSSIPLYVGLLVLCALTFLIRGYSFGAEDQNLLLPYVYHWNNPACFPHDYLLDLTFAKGSIVWPAVAFLSRLWSIEALLLALYLGAMYATLVLTFKTALVLSGDRAAAWLAVILTIPAYPVPGAGIPTFDSYFTASTLGIAVASLALFLFLKGKNGGSCAAVAGGTAVHLLSILPIAAGIGFAHLRSRRWIWLAALTVSFVAPALLLVLLGAGRGPGHDLFSIYGGEWFAFLWRKLPDSFPQAWSGTTWLQVGCYVAAWSVSSWQLAKEGGNGPGERLNRVMWGALILLVLGFAGAYLRWALLVQLSLFRANLWIIYALTLLTAWWLIDLMRSKSLLSRLLAVFLATSWLFGGAEIHAAVMVVLVAQRQASRAELATRRFWKAISLLAAGAILLVQASAFFGRVGEHGLREQESLAGLLLAAGLFMVFAAAFSRCRRDLNTPSTFLALLVVLSMMPSESMINNGLFAPVLSIVVPRVGIEAAEAVQRGRAEMWMEGMETLVRSRVPADATVIVSPRWMRFRIETMRSSFVTFKDRCGLLYSPTFAAEWIARMKAIHAYRAGDWTMNDSLNLTRDELIRLADDYRDIGLDYIVTTRDYPMPMLGRSGPLKLYKIPPVSSKPETQDSENGPAGRMVH